MKKTDFTFQIHVTNKCEYNCKYCYLENKSNEMDIATFDIVLDKIKQFESNLEKTLNREVNIKCNLTGGNPLLQKNIRYFIDSLKKYNVGILGNPILNEDQLCVIDDNKNHIRAYQMSLDEKRSKGYEKELINSINILSYLGIRVIIAYNINNKNIDMVCGAYKKMSKYDVSGFVISRIAYDNNIIESAKYKKMLYKLIELEKKYKLKIHYKEPLFSLCLYEKGLLKIDDTNKIRGGCSIGLKLFCIGTNGDIYPCSRLKKVVGNVKTDNFENVYVNNEYMKSLRNKTTYGKCGKCELYRYCRGCIAVDSENITCWKSSYDINTEYDMSIYESMARKTGGC